MIKCYMLSFHNKCSCLPKREIGSLFASILEYFGSISYLVESSRYTVKKQKKGIKLTNCIEKNRTYSTMCLYFSFGTHFPKQCEHKCCYAEKT